MKKKVALLVSISLMLTLLFGTFTTASARASAYFSSYDAWLTKNSDGTISASIDVTGVGPMTSLGAKSIVIQKYNSSTGEWDTAATFSSSSYAILGSNVSSYSKSVKTSSSMSAGKYRAYVTFYAKNSSGGSETKYYTSSSITIS